MKSDTETNCNDNNNNTEEPKITMIGDEEKKDGSNHMHNHLQQDDAESVPKKKSEIQIVDGNWVSRCTLLGFFLLL